MCTKCPTHLILLVLITAVISVGLLHVSAGYIILISLVAWYALTVFCCSSEINGRTRCCSWCHWHCTNWRTWGECGESTPLAYGTVYCCKLLFWRWKHYGVLKHCCSHTGLIRLLYCGVWRCGVWKTCTNMLWEHGYTASIIRVQQWTLFTLVPWRWRQQVHLKCLYPSTRLHGVNQEDQNMKLYFHEDLKS